ncbi:hypothetical protein E2C01_007441 [Portunus trituberculatus]|uniref:Uncharacterized protein n=1 Tax=Portunus trituberculatus TaxID=210409 RepID=A0A5B7CZ16_PORTR|nr:hypothetical protein [Portunus trituberculatus]
MRVAADEPENSFRNVAGSYLLVPFPSCSPYLPPHSPPPDSSHPRTAPPRQEVLDLLFPAPCCGYASYEYLLHSRTRHSLDQRLKTKQ